MSALMLKDYYTLSKQLKLYLVFILVLSVIPQMNLISIGAVYAAMLPITVMAYDERSKWDHLAVMMPYSSRQIVLSKYLIGYIGIAITSILGILIQLAINAVKHTATTQEQLLAVVVTSCVALVLLAINLPFMFWLGVERGRIAFLVIVGVTVFVGMMSSQQSEKLLSLPDISGTWIIAASVAAAMLANVASMLISSRIYETKRLKQ